MTQFKIIFNSLPRDLAEFIFFLIVGFTAGTLGFSLIEKDTHNFSLNTIKILQYILFSLF